MPRIARPFVAPSPRSANTVSLPGRRPRGGGASAGRACDLFEQLETRSLFAAGDLDPAFGPGGPDGNGIVTTNIPVASAATNDAARSIVVQPDQKILVGGVTGSSADAATNDFALARYNSDGSLDLSFGGGDGIVTTDFGSSDALRALALTADGHIVAVGVSGTGTAADWAIARYNPDGSLDTTFSPGGTDGSGKLLQDFFTRADTANGVTIDNAGKIVITGEATGVNTQLVVARYNPDGSLDPTFDNDGTAFVDFFENTDTGSEVRVQADNKIVVVGSAAPRGSYSRFILVRFNPDGSPDFTFGTGGKATADFGGTAYGQDLVIAPHGEIIVGGLVDAPGGAATDDFAVARFLPNGTLDTSFGAGGRTVVNGFSGDALGHYGLAQQADGKLLLGGFQIQGQGGAGVQTAFGAARFNFDGTIDTSFGTGGTVRTTVPGSASSAGYDLALQADGKIVMAGQATPSTPAGGGDFAVLRYLNTISVPGSVAGTVFEDLDADGVRDAGESGLAGWTVYQDLNNNGTYESGVSTVSSTDLPKTIPDNNPTGTTSTLTVANLTGDLVDVNVTLSIAHTYDPDLRVTLISPTGGRILLFNNVGNLPGSTGNANFDNTTLDDQAAVAIGAGRPPFRGSYVPQELLSQLIGQNPNGTWKLELVDTAADDQGTLFAWSLTLTTRSEPSTVTDASGNYSFPTVAPGTYTIREVPQAGFTQTTPANGAGHVVTVTEGQAVTGRDFGNVRGTVPAVVVGRRVFYNNSAFDGRNPAANESDINAVANDKNALRPGEVGTFDNVTSYPKGITGIIVELRNLPPAANLTAADFQFRAGNTADPSTWAAAPAPAQVVTLRSPIPEAPARVHITWADGAIVNKWLQVTVLQNANTRLAANDVFYFGNLPGETGDPTSRLAVTPRDQFEIRRHLFNRNAAVTNRYDLDRDGDVDAMDVLVARRNNGARLSALGGPGAAGARPAASLFADAPALEPSRVWDEQPAALL